ncbi:MAG: hypothetical protein A2Z27_03545 [candidate division Zixibacteria bacterium RBG_16_50_21]|nr:MAG: hypothetical protein A2Z27_03545 [candidate division Zixibacteria bacterium RBG_16_50_21]
MAKKSWKTGKRKSSKNAQTNPPKFAIQASDELYPKRLKTCLLELLQNGVRETGNPRKWESMARRRVAIYILMEMKRLGYSLERASQEILAWNEKNAPSLNQKQVDKNLIPLVAWVFEKGGELGCKKSLLEHKICFIENRACDYYEEFLKNRRGADNLYDEQEFIRKGWEYYLRENYCNWMTAVAIYEELRTFGREKGISQDGKVNIGCARLGARIKLRYKDIDTSPMAVYRGLMTLVEVGLMTIPERGYYGRSRWKKANGYIRIMPIPDLPEPINSGEAKMELRSGSHVIH